MAVTDNDADLVQIPDAEFREAMDEMLREQAAADARYLELAACYPADVRALHDVMVEGTGVSDVIRQLLRAVHRKHGPLDLHELRRLDLGNRARALRLIEVMTRPSILPDVGLGRDPDGNQLLTADEIEALLANDG
jgi:hypothetical protein